MYISHVNHILSFIIALHRTVECNSNGVTIYCIVKKTKYTLFLYIVYKIVQKYDLDVMDGSIIEISKTFGMHFKIISLQIV